MKRDITDYLDDIIESINQIGLFIGDMTYEEFFLDIKTSHAVIRSLEIIGEAAKHIPQNIRDSNHLVPWKQMAGMRDKLIHEYFGADFKMVWLVCKNELPKILPIIAQIKNQQLE